MKKRIIQMSIMLLFLGCAQKNSINKSKSIGLELYKDTYTTLRVDNQNKQIGELKIEGGVKYEVVNDSDMFISYRGKLLHKNQEDTTLIEHLEHNPEIFLETKKNWLPFDNDYISRTKIGYEHVSGRGAEYISEIEDNIDKNILYKYIDENIIANDAIFEIVKSTVPDDLFVDFPTEYPSSTEVYTIDKVALDEYISKISYIDQDDKEKISTYIVENVLKFDDSQSHYFDFNKESFDRYLEDENISNSVITDKNKKVNLSTNNINLELDFKLNKNWTITPKVWAYFDTPNQSEIEKYYGNFDLKAQYKNQNYSFAASLRGNPSSQKGRVKLDFLMPTPIDNIAYYLQYFDGYGESLRTYDLHTRALRAGFIFANFNSNMKQPPRSTIVDSINTLETIEIKKPLIDVEPSVIDSYLNYEPLIVASESKKRVVEQQKKYKLVKPFFVKVNIPEEENRITPLSIKVEVPNLIGFRERDAQILIEGRGLIIGDIISATSENWMQYDTVLEQSLPFGQKVDKGTKIDFTMARKMVLGVTSVESPKIVEKSTLTFKEINKVLKVLIEENISVAKEKNISTVDPIVEKNQTIIKPYIPPSEDSNPIDLPLWVVINAILLYLGLKIYKSFGADPSSSFHKYSRAIVEIFPKNSEPSYHIEMLPNSLGVSFRSIRDNGEHSVEFIYTSIKE